MGTNTRNQRPSLSVSVLAVCAATLLVLTGCDEKGESPKPTAAPSEAAPAVALSDLLTAEVPALCEHDPGTLVDGMLPGIEKLNDQVGLDPTLLEEIQSGKDTSELAMIGETADGEPFIAASMYCDRGGVTWPSVVVAWNADGEILGSFNPSSVTGGDRERVVAVLPPSEGSEGDIVAHWIATNEYDAACCGQVSVQSPLTFSADELVPGRTIIARGATQVLAVVEAAMKQTQAPDIAVPDGLYESLARANEQFGPFLPDDVSCDDGMSVDGGTLICGIPLASGSTFIVYPVMTEWGKYDIKSYEYELW